MLLCYGIGLLMFIIAITFYFEIAPKFIKGYQMMSEQEKAGINIKALSQNLSLMFFIVSFIFLVAGYSEDFLENNFRIAMIIWLIICGLDIAYINKSDKFIITN
ncbi:MAG: DUF3784 domain-containing protein [Erysipelotrichales bacterium]